MLRSGPKPGTPRNNPKNPPPSGLRPFPKGVSGNPGGRPKKTLATDACRYLAEGTLKDLEPKEGDTLVLIAAKRLIREAISGKLRAIREFFDRVEGSPPQRHEITGEDGGPIPLGESATAEELRARLANLAGRILAREGDAGGAS